MPPRRKQIADPPPKRRRPPATSVESRENQMIAYAVDLAEQQLIEGTASAQVITHYLKLGTTREILEKERIANQNVLLRAQAENIASATRIEALYSDAIMAMRAYQGTEQMSNNEDD